jgi:hypothetical protein
MLGPTFGGSQYSFRTFTIAFAYDGTSTSIIVGVSKWPHQPLAQPSNYP